MRDLRSSSIYRTKARYVEDQPDFYNLVVSGVTELEPENLLSAIQGVEARFGRDRSRERFKGPRSLDVDILLYGELRLSTDQLSIPHPGMLERAFVLVPLCELDPDLRDPVTLCPFSEAIAATSGQGIYHHAPPPL